MEYSDDVKNQIQQLALLASDAQRRMQQTVLPLVTLANEYYHNQMGELISKISQLSLEASSHLNEGLALAIQRMSDNSRLNTEFKMPVYIAESIAEIHRKLEILMPVKEGESSLAASISVRNKSQEDRFTWRDALTIIGILLALLSFINDLTGKDDTPEVIEIRNEIKLEMEQTINNVVSHYYINFPDDDSDSDQSDHEYPDSNQ